MMFDTCEECSLYLFYNVVYFSYMQRNYTRKNYDDNLDDEIEGKRTFSVMEKLADPKFRNGNFVQILPNANG